MDRELESLQAVFVIGSPRSGTTMLGQLIGSSPQVLRIGELSAFVLSCFVAPKEYRRVPSPFKESYLQYLKRGAVEFVFGVCSGAQKGYFVEDTPWNFLVHRELREMFPRSVFVLCFRRAQPVVRSMRSSYLAGYRWAGPTDEERVKLWIRAYEALADLPMGSTIFFSYDEYIDDSEKTIDRLATDLSRKGIPVDIDRSILALRFAQSGRGQVDQCPIQVSSDSLARIASVERAMEALRVKIGNHERTA